MTGHGDFPAELQHLLDELDREEFVIIYGEVEGVGPGFLAAKGETVILVTDASQTWFCTFRGPERPDVEECWDYPNMVRGKVWEWLQDYPAE